MLTQKSNSPKIWLRFPAFRRDGSKINFRIQNLQEDRFEEFMDFNMEYYVKNEFSHIIAGIPSSKEAMNDYREITSKILKDPLYQIVICVDDDAPHSKIIGMSIIKLFKRGEVYKDIVQPKTSIVKKFFRMLEQWDEIFSVPDLMNEYNIEYLYDDRAMATHPEYRSFGVGQKLATSRRMICIEQGVPLAGAWITSYGSQKSAERDGWINIFEITREQLGERLGIPIKEGPATFRYVVAIVSMEDNIKNKFNHKTKNGVNSKY